MYFGNRRRSKYTHLCRCIFKNLKKKKNQIKRNEEELASVHMTHNIYCVDNSSALVAFTGAEQSLTVHHKQNKLLFKRCNKSNKCLFLRHPLKCLYM